MIITTDRKEQESDLYHSSERSVIVYDDVHRADSRMFQAASEFIDFTVLSRALLCSRSCRSYALLLGMSTTTSQCGK
jgi:hypothetical protein